jgi:hypothetical protein
MATATAVTPDVTDPLKPTGILSTAQQPAAPAPSSPGILARAQAETPLDYTKQLTDLYSKDLGRAPDAGGLDYWNHAMQGGDTLDSVNASFLSSDEYKKAHPVQSPGAAPVAAGYTPSTLGDPTKWAVTKDQTVAGQMEKYSDPNNPYTQQWGAIGAEGAAGRGFTGNSTIRDTGILNSVMSSATPIATADAATQAKAAGYNADELNQFQVAEPECVQHSERLQRRSDELHDAGAIGLGDAENHQQQHAVVLREECSAGSAHAEIHGRFEREHATWRHGQEQRDGACADEYLGGYPEVHGEHGLDHKTGIVADEHRKPSRDQPGARCELESDSEQPAGAKGVRFIRKRGGADRPERENARHVESRCHRYADCDVQSGDQWPQGCKPRPI